MLQIAVLDVALDDGAVPELAVAIVAAAEAEDDRQRDLAFAEVVADRLAERALSPRLIERIVDELEGDAEVAAVGPSAACSSAGRPAMRRTDLGAAENSAAVLASMIAR